MFAVLVQTDYGMCKSPFSMHGSWFELIVTLSFVQIWCQGQPSQPQDVQVLACDELLISSNLSVIAPKGNDFRYFS
jgi:hypothetical protein